MLYINENFVYQDTTRYRDHVTFHIRIIRTSSREQNNLLPERIAELKAAGATVVYDEIPPDASWPYAAGSIADRGKSLERALLDAQTDYIWVARGGYGASDLLSQLNWEKLKATTPKLIIGFSDVSALHAAFYTKLGWPGLHAPMPATTLWRLGDVGHDIDQTIAMLKTGTFRGGIACTPVSGNASATISGPLFGGCMSVLTNLIGTEYFPRSLADTILFFEDTGENPGRLVRFWNQWLQSHVLQGVKAVVFGNFRDLDAANKWQNSDLAKIFAERAPQIPLYVSNDFGHVCPNLPLLIGADAKIENGRLTWEKKNTKELNV